MRPHNAIFISLALTACAHVQPRVEYREVKIPIPVQCAVDPEPHRPALPDPTTAPDIFEAAKRAKARDRLLGGQSGHGGYVGELESAYQTCTGHPVPD